MELRTEQEGPLPRISARGPMTPEDNSRLLEEIKGVFADGEAHLLVLCEADLELLQTSSENHALQSQTRNFFSQVRGGALAMVCLNDVMFAVCRQFQLMATSSRARLEVFRTEMEGREWLVERKAFAARGKSTV
jgi:hypothetical protein